MKKRFINREHLTYDELYDISSNSRDESEIRTEIYENYYQKNDENVRNYSKAEVDCILKECIENMVVEIEEVVSERFGNYNFNARYNKNIYNWNEVLCSIDVSGKFVNVKLSNDFVCDDMNNITSVYITLFSSGKGIFTECIQRVNQEYEFIESIYAYMPIKENELCFKELNKDKFINCIVSEIEKIIYSAA